MKIQKIKLIIGTLFSMFLLTSNLVLGQCRIHVTDNVTPLPATGDTYEVTWTVIRIISGTPVTYTCSPNTTIPFPLSYNYGWPYPAYFTCTLPTDEQDYRVAVGVKRKNSFNAVVAGGEGVSSYMTPYEIQNTAYDVYVTLTN